jgi:predicted NAD/FAD-dependent oxidoreductase
MNRSGAGGPTRRAVLAAGSAAALATVAGCERSGNAVYDGGWVGAAFERGHLLRSGMPVTKSGAPPDAAVVRRAGVLVVGAGIAGLAAARALIEAGVDDVRVLDLEDAAGGNSRGHAMGGMRCPLGAHYLPVPGEHAIEVIELLERLGVRRTVNGRIDYDERMLCHSPQERLYIHGGWRDGLLPPIEALPAAERTATLAQYRAFSAAVSEAGRGDAFAIPTARSRWSPALDALDAVTFATWLDGRGLVAPALRWYLDYCCRDDYGAGSRQVSAWAGIHYFASRHGFHAPGSDDAAEADASEGLLTWPEGNAWLAGHLAAPLGGRFQSARVVLRVEEERSAVSVDAWNVATQQRERWLASQVVLATPLFVSSRLLAAPPAALVDAARLVRHAPWLVANLQLAAALDDQPGAPLSWDNVLYDSPGLGYVDAMHQSTLPFAGPTVLTAYRALGGDDAAELAAQRARLLQEDWRTSTARIVAELAGPHPDLPAKLKRVDLMRYGHAMSIPTPGLRSSAALQALAGSTGRVHFAHTDLSAYSVFEEALFHGSRAGRAAAARSVS